MSDAASDHPQTFHPLSPQNLPLEPLTFRNIGINDVNELWFSFSLLHESPITFDDELGLFSLPVGPFSLPSPLFQSCPSCLPIRCLQSFHHTLFHLSSY